jgi:hypothetical protein
MSCKNAMRKVRVQNINRILCKMIPTFRIPGFAWRIACNPGISSREQAHPRREMRDGHQRVHRHHAAPWRAAGSATQNVTGIIALRGDQRHERKDRRSGQGEAVSRSHTSAMIARARFFCRCRPHDRSYSPRLKASTPAEDTLSHSGSILPSGE